VKAKVSIFGLCKVFPTHFLFHHLNDASRAYKLINADYIATCINDNDEFLRFYKHQFFRYYRLSDNLLIIKNIFKNILLYVIYNFSNSLITIN